MKSIAVMTFADFLDVAEKNTMLIYPEDELTKDRNELGVIVGWNWTPITLSNNAKSVIYEKYIGEAK